MLRNHRLIANTLYETQKFIGLEESFLIFGCFFHFFSFFISPQNDHWGQGPGGIWCDVDVVEFSYYGAPAATPKEEIYTELVDGLRGSDPTIGSGSQVPFYLFQKSEILLYMTVSHLGKWL